MLKAPATATGDEPPDASKALADRIGGADAVLPVVALEGFLPVTRRCKPLAPMPVLSQCGGRGWHLC